MLDVATSASRHRRAITLAVFAMLSLPLSSSVLPLLHQHAGSQFVRCAKPAPTRLRAELSCVPACLPLYRVQTAFTHRSRRLLVRTCSLCDDDTRAASMRLLAPSPARVIRYNTCAAAAATNEDAVNTRMQKWTRLSLPLLLSFRHQSFRPPSRSAATGVPPARARSHSTPPFIVAAL